MDRTVCIYHCAFSKRAQIRVDRMDYGVELQNPTWSFYKTDRMVGINRIKIVVSRDFRGPVTIVFA